MNIIFNLPHIPAFLPIDRHFQLVPHTLDHHRLIIHPARDIKGGPGFAPKRQFQDILLHASLDGLLELVLYFKVPVRGAQSPDALVRPSVVEIFYPLAHPLLCFLKIPEPGPAKKLPVDRFPKTLYFTERHGVMWAAFQVMHFVLGQLGLESGRAPPIRILAAIIGQHLLRDPVFTDGDTVNLYHMLGRLAPE
jgi:hypothetical protein